MPKAFQFTEENMIYIKENWGKESITSMSNKIGCTRKALTKKALDLGIYNPTSTKWTQEEDEFLKKHLGKWSAEKIGHKLNKTVEAIYARTKRLGISNKTEWTPEEEFQLEELWGTVSIETIVKKLNRTVTAIKVKAKKMHLGSAFDANGEYLRISEIEKILNVDGNRIRYTWVPNGLKCYKVKISHNYQILGVTIDDLLIFLEQNQDAFDARYLEENILGLEPKWLKEKRKRDFQNPPPEYRPWNNNEISILKMLVYKGKSYQEIGEKINRTPIAIGMKVRKLGLGCSTFWTPEEEALLKQNYENGYLMNYETIAQELGRSSVAVAQKCRSLRCSVKDSKQNL